jgi:hypothetical protein
VLVNYLVIIAGPPNSLQPSGTSYVVDMRMRGSLGNTSPIAGHFKGIHGLMGILRLGPWRPAEALTGSYPGNEKH